MYFNIVQTRPIGYRRILHKRARVTGKADPYLTAYISLPAIATLSLLLLCLTQPRLLSIKLNDVVQIRVPNDKIFEPFAKEEVVNL
jgi:hypothetical protein